jgi:GH25 family lysozyme M1 (1,4-beta-N-acetylmuramidase)
MCGAILTAAQPAGASADPVSHPERDWLGSQVAKHQPKSGASVVRPDVAQTPGLDVSGWQGDVDWASVAANGARFAYSKATESTNYTNPYFSQQYTGAYNAGLVHGAYHFATPNITIWQFAEAGTFPSDQDYFNGDYSRVQALANG